MSDTMIDSGYTPVNKAGLCPDSVLAMNRILLDGLSAVKGLEDFKSCRHLI